MGFRWRLGKGSGRTSLAKMYQLLLDSGEEVRQARGRRERRKEGTGHTQSRRTGPLLARVRTILIPKLGSELTLGQPHSPASVSSNAAFPDGPLFTGPQLE